MTAKVNTMMWVITNVLSGC